MYQLLNEGKLGNTNPNFLSLAEWLPHKNMTELWGVRVYKVGDPRFLTNIHKDDVEKYVKDNFTDGEYLISAMVDKHVVFRGDIWESVIQPAGLYIYGTRNNTLPWRDALKYTGRHYSGIIASTILRHYCDPDSLDNIYRLLEEYPEHVIEVSVCDKNIGTVPNRNTIIWEVRCSDGSYENWPRFQ